MVARMSVMVLRFAAVLALILGILFWIGVNESLKSVHMLLGLIVTFCLLILGSLMITTKRGNVGLGVGAIVLAIVVVVFGMQQLSIQPSISDPSSPLHQVVKVVHLLLGLAAIGVGEMIGRRLKGSR